MQASDGSQGQIEAHEQLWESCCQHAFMWLQGLSTGPRTGMRIHCRSLGRHLACAQVERLELAATGDPRLQQKGEYREQRGTQTAGICKCQNLWSKNMSGGIRRGSVTVVLAIGFLSGKRARIHDKVFSDDS